jgi:hypothetical protein
VTRHARLKQRAVDLGVCIYSGCETPPWGDTFMCERHALDHRRRVAASEAKRAVREADRQRQLDLLSAVAVSSNLTDTPR